MKIQELLVETDEEDFPIVYNIIRKKLAAGQEILLDDRHNTTVERRVVELSPVRDQDSNLCGELSWELYKDDMFLMDLGSNFSPKDMEEWKLTKIDNRWTLTVP